MQNILFVCTGNTCRSAMAEGICRKICLDQNYDIKAQSCGLAAVSGLPASQNAVLALSTLYNIDISSHLSKEASYELLNEANIIFVMTAAHAQPLLSIEAIRNKVRIAAPEISDPYGGELSKYKACAQQLYLQISDLLSEVNKNAV